MADKKNADGKTYVIVYLTKYALSKGISQFTAELYESRGVTYYYCNDPENGIYYGLQRAGVDAFADRDEAIADAQERARRKLISLDRQMKKIQKLVDQPKWSK